MPTAVQLPPTPGGSDGAAPSADQHAGWAPTAIGNAGSGGAQPSPAVGAAADYDEAYRHLSQLQLDGDENQQPGTHTATAAPMVSGSCAPLAPAQPFGNGQQHMTVAQALDALHATPPTARQPLRFRDCPAGTVDLSQTYEVREQLGRGAVDGVVVRFAHHRATGEPVAIKEIPKKVLKTERLRETTSRELEIMMLVADRAPADLAVVKLYAIVETESMIYIVMELVAGGELFEHIVQAGSYDEGKTRTVIRQLLEALRHLHTIGITHRDIKPENILCAANGVDIKIADFGLSNSFSAMQSSMRSQCGTPIYMAPEMLQRQPYGPSVDVWSAGIVMYVTLSGSLPFYADNQVDFLELLLTSAVEFPEDEWAHISDAAKSLIAAMLTVEPSQRVSIDAALAHPWMHMGAD